MLHARRLTLTHPHSGKSLELVAPWPTAFAEVVALMGLELPEV